MFSSYRHDADFPISVPCSGFHTLKMFVRNNIYDFRSGSLLTLDCDWWKYLQDVYCIRAPGRGTCWENDEIYWKGRSEIVSVAAVSNEESNWLAWYPDCVSIHRFIFHYGIAHSVSVFYAARNYADTCEKSGGKISPDSVRIYGENLSVKNLQFFSGAHEKLIRKDLGAWTMPLK